MPDDEECEVPRIRTLKPEAFQHRKVGRLSHIAFRLWVGMLCHADDYGRLVGDPDQLRVLLFAYHRGITACKVEEALREITALGLVTTYHNNGTRYVSFPSWFEHQKISHPTPSRLPSPDDSGNTPEDSGDFQSPLASRARADRIGSDLIGSGSNTGKLRQVAEGLLKFLNEKAGRSFRPVPATIDPIVCRLRDGATEQDCRAVIARKVREWRGDERMAKYLRPETLFNRTKFESYLGESSPEASHGG